MTNEQLQLLLLGWLAELDAAIDGAREAMPGAAEREQWREWRTKAEYIGTYKAMFDLTGETREAYQYEGEYLALVPLVALRDAWRGRVDMLTTGATE